MGYGEQVRGGAPGGEVREISSQVKGPGGGRRGICTQVGGGQYLGRVKSSWNGERRGDQWDRDRYCTLNLVGTAR